MTEVVTGGRTKETKKQQEAGMERRTRAQVKLGPSKQMRHTDEHLVFYSLLFLN